MRTIQEQTAAAYRDILHIEADRNAKRRSAAAYARNLAEPGDCSGDDAMLRGLAIAESYIGRRAGWIPETQKLGVEFADYVSVNP